MIQLGGFLGRLLRPLLKNGFPLLGNVLQPLAKRVLVPLGLSEAASPTDTANQKKILGSGAATLIFSNKDLSDIIKRVKSLEDTGLLMKGVTETVENEVKGKKEDFRYVSSSVSF